MALYKTILILLVISILYVPIKSSKSTNRLPSGARLSISCRFQGSGGAIEILSGEWVKNPGSNISDEHKHDANVRTIENLRRSCNNKQSCSLNLKYHNNEKTAREFTYQAKYECHYCPHPDFVAKHYFNGVRKIESFARDSNNRRHEFSTITSIFTGEIKYNRKENTV